MKILFARQRKVAAKLTVGCTPMQPRGEQPKSLRRLTAAQLKGFSAAEMVHFSS